MSIERRIAGGDLGLFLLLAIPGLGSSVIDGLFELNRRLSWSGDAELAGLSPLLLSLLGVLGVGFAWARLSAAEGRLRLPTITVKFAAALLFIGAVLGGAPAILLGLALADGVAAILLIRRRR
jgi:hypothetical protein